MTSPTPTAVLGLLSCLLVASGCNAVVSPTPPPTPGTSPPTHTSAPVTTTGPAPTPTGGRGIADELGRDPADWIGVWHGADDTGIVPVDVETSMLANKTFTTLNSNYSASYQLYVRGKWDIFDFGDGPFLRFAVEDWEPKEWCGPTMQCSPILIPERDTRYFRFQDRNTVDLWGYGCSGPEAGCAITFRRAP